MDNLQPSRPMRPMSSYSKRDKKSKSICRGLDREFMGRIGRVAASSVTMAIVQVIIALLAAWLLLSRQAWLLVPTDVDAYAAAHAAAHAAIAVCVSPAARGCVSWCHLYRPVAPPTSHLARSEPGNTRVIRYPGTWYRVQLHSGECARVLPGTFPLTGQQIARGSYTIKNISYTTDH